MPTLKIDGREVSVDKDTNLLEACRKLDIYVPHFCYHPGLSIAAQCRLCLVEIAKNPKLQPACQIPAADGMEVSCSNPRVTEARRAMMELHLINHPVDCPICDKAGECTLQDYYMAYDMGDSRLEFRKVGKHKVSPIGPRIMYDGERCVMCTRCVRFTHEVSHSGQLSIGARGDRSYITTLPGKELDEAYSLNTVDLCPVGALTSRDFRFQRRVWFMKATASVCHGCATGCNIEVHQADGQLHRITPRVNMAVNQWWCCDDGRLTYKEAGASRLIDARVRTAQGAQQPVKVEVALGQVVTALKQVIQSGSGSSVGVVLSPQATNEDNYVLSRFATEFLQAGGVYISDGRAEWQGDKFLRSADHNPNRAGAIAVRDVLPAELRLRSLAKDLKDGSIRTLVVLGGEAPGDGMDADGPLGKLEHLVVLSPQETPLSRLAHVVLPTTTSFEVDGTFTNVKGMVQRLRPSIPPRGESLPAWKLVVELCRKLELALDYPSARAVHEEMLGRVPALKAASSSPGGGWGIELHPRVISGSPIHEAPEVPFEQFTSHQSPVAEPVPTYAGFRK